MRVLSRRLLLAGTAGIALAGCSSVPPVPGLPGTTPDAPQMPYLPGYGALFGVRKALDAAAATPLTPAQADLLSWMYGVNDDHLALLRLPASARVQPTAVASPVPAAPPTSAPTASPAAPASATPAPAAGWAALGTALSAAVPVLSAQALEASNARPVVWQSMAAWCGAAAASLGRADLAPEPASSLQLPAPIEAHAAAQEVADAASATLFGLQVAAGTPGWSDAELSALRDRLGFWAGLRDDLSGAFVKASASPTPAPPWYDAQASTDAAAARAEVLRLQSAALPILGRAFEYGPAEARTLLAKAITNVASDLPRWGGLLLRWPGLPA